MQYMRPWHCVNQREEGKWRMANGQGHSICVDRLVPVSAWSNPSLDRLDRAAIASSPTAHQVTVIPSVFPCFVFGARLAGYLKGSGAFTFRASSLCADSPCGASVSSRRCLSRITMPLTSHRFLACSHMPPGSHPISLL